MDNTFASPVPPAAAIARRRHGGAQHDEILERAQRQRRRRSSSRQRDDDIDWLRFIQNAAGAILSPFDSWLVLRGTKTLAVRMAQHNANGLALARLPGAAPEGHAGALPGSDPSAVRPRPAADAGFGGMLSFDVGDFEAARRVCNSVRLMSLAESLGGVETLI